MRHFEDHEQAFFDEEHRLQAEHQTEGSEDFTDLDDGKRPLSLWERLLANFRKPAPRR